MTTALCTRVRAYKRKRKCLHIIAEKTALQSAKPTIVTVEAERTSRHGFQRMLSDITAKCSAMGITPFNNLLNDMYSQKFALTVQQSFFYKVLFPEILSPQPFP